MLSHHFTNLYFCDVITSLLYSESLTATLVRSMCIPEGNALHLWHICVCYSPAGRSVFGETVPEVWVRPRAVLRPRAQFLPIRADLSRWITFWFFSNWNLKVSGKFSFTLQPMCVEVRCVRVDEARDRLQTKTKYYNMIFSSVIYIMELTALF